MQLVRRLARSAGHEARMRIRSALPLLPLVIVPSTHCASGAMWRRSDGDEGLEAAERASLVAYLETL